MEDKNQNQEPEEFEMDEELTAFGKIKKAAKTAWKFGKYVLTAAIGWGGKALFDRFTGKDDDDEDEGSSETEETSEE
jgi:hypothetical protein